MDASSSVHQTKLTRRTSPTCVSSSFQNTVDGYRCLEYFRCDSQFFAEIERASLHEAMILVCLMREYGMACFVQVIHGDSSLHPLLVVSFSKSCFVYRSLNFTAEHKAASQFHSYSSSPSRYHSPLPLHFFISQDTGPHCLVLGLNLVIESCLRLPAWNLPALSCHVWTALASQGKAWCWQRGLYLRPRFFCVFQ